MIQTPSPPSEIVAGLGAAAGASYQQAPPPPPFPSTPGIEAVYLGVPSVLAAEMNYDHLDSTYNPDSHEHLVKLLLTNLKPKRKLGAYIFGYYQMNYGKPYKYYKSNGLFSGLFKGKNLEENKPLTRFFYNIHRKKIHFFYLFILYIFNKRSNLFGRIKR